MWVFLNNAFLSIVQDKDDSGYLMVRARLRGDIQRAFGPGQQVLETPPPADYRFRARINRLHVVRLLTNSVLDIDYTNFKKSVEETARHDAYLRVWSEMWRAQEDDLMPPVFPGDAIVATVKSSRVVTQSAPRKPVNPRGKKGSRPRSNRR